MFDPGPLGRAVLFGEVPVGYTFRVWRLLPRLKSFIPDSDLFQKIDEDSAIPVIKKREEVADVVYNIFSFSVVVWVATEPTLTEEIREEFQEATEGVSESVAHTKVRKVVKNGSDGLCLVYYF